MGVRTETVLKILKGLGTAVLVTLLGMAILAALVIFTPVSDGWLTALNQVLKVAAIFAGVLLGVGRGGERGFATGALIGLVYMVLGYLIYSIIDGMLAPAGQMALEFLMGALIGAIAGIIVANLKPKKRKLGKRKMKLA